MFNVGTGLSTWRLLPLFTLWINLIFANSLLRSKCGSRYLNVLFFLEYHSFAGLLGSAFIYVTQGTHPCKHFFAVLLLFTILLTFFSLLFVLLNIPLGTVFDAIQLSSDPYLNKFYLWSLWLHFQRHVDNECYLLCADLSLFCSFWKKIFLGSFIFPSLLPLKM